MRGVIMKKVIQIMGVVFVSGLLVAGCAKKQMVAPEQVALEQAGKDQKAGQSTEGSAIKAGAGKQASDNANVTSRAITDARSELKRVHFDYDRYNIKSEFYEVLEHDAKILKEFKPNPVVIEGHCDERGSVEYNLALGERRAKAVKDYLMVLGARAWQ
jgi:peptidoglycan-associated lipoprotein